MNGIKVLLWLFLLAPGTVCAQEYNLTGTTQNLSTGALFYEYRKHPDTANAPTIVFESGALNSSGYWDPVIDSVSQYANTLRYDRAGLGRSLSSTDTIRAADRIANELNELLDSLRITEKIILVCHSAGGFYGRAFAHRFGKRVRALVLIESPCTQWESLLRSGLTESQNEQRDAALAQNQSGYPFFQRKEYQAAEINRRILDQIPKMEIPVSIIFGDSHQWPEDYNSEVLNEKWEACQRSLADISVNSKTIIAQGAGHHIFREFDLSRFLKNTIDEGHKP